MYKNSFWVMVICILTISCTEVLSKNTLSPKKYKSKGPVTRFVDRNAAIGIGVNAKTDQVFLINSLTGSIQTSCGNPNLVIEKYQNKKNKQIQQKSDCKQEIMHPSRELINAIMKTQHGHSIKGVLRNKKGIEKNVLFHLVLVSSSQGSYCSTHFVAGRQYERCVTQQDECEEYRNIDYPPSEATLEEFLLDYPECQNIITE